MESFLLFRDFEVRKKKSKKQNTLSCLNLSLPLFRIESISHQLRRAGHAHAHLAVVRELDAGVEGGLEREFFVYGKL